MAKLKFTGQRAQRQFVGLAPRLSMALTITVKPRAPLPLERGLKNGFNEVRVQKPISVRILLNPGLTKPNRGFLARCLTMSIEVGSYQRCQLQ